MPDSSIGVFQFISLLGEVYPPSQGIAPPVVRPGVDEVGLWKTGIRGRPFVMRSAVDQTNMDAAQAELKSYRELIGQDPVPLIQDGYDYSGQQEFNVAVLDVRKLQLTKIGTAAGGLNPPSEAKLVCEWTLIAVSNTA